MQEIQQCSIVKFWVWLEIFLSKNKVFVDFDCESKQLYVIVIQCFSNISDELTEGLSAYKDRLFISQLCLPKSESQPCGLECELLRGSSHAVTLLGRAFCCRSPSSVVYIANSCTQNILNFALSLQGKQMRVVIYLHLKVKYKTFEMDFFWLSPWNEKWFFLRQRHFKTNWLNLGWLLKSFIKGKVFWKPGDPTINPTRVYPRVQGCDA